MKKNEIDYSELSKELEEILNSLRSPEINIEEATIKYQRGIELINSLENYLDSAQTKITKIK